ncbi:MAG: UDP-N-acetylmuramate--L-alanine ligase [Clostridia bacterium]|nr:UDP-N-acetylmuramate--L-alanine ligase [Clostridia bacterium]
MEKNIDNLLKEVKRIHFIGIGGSGMCPLAEILYRFGYELSGSDNNPGDNIDKLRSMGIPVVIGQKPENIEGAQMVIYTAAILPDNPELVAAKGSDIPTFERAKLFGAITRMYPDCIGVCGTHGKTTVTSMITQIMVEAGRDPSAVIGGKLPVIDSHGLVGQSETLVCEACEFNDHFLDLSPDVAVILNVDEDHLEYFKNLGNIIKSFNTFATMATKAVIYNGDDENTLAAVCDVKTKKISFGRGAENDYSCRDVEWVNGSYACFTVTAYGETLGTVELSVPGEHNIIDALAAIAAAMNEGVPFEQCSAALKHFGGASRRFEKLGVFKGVTVVDDYAHHPKELEVTLGCAMKLGYKRVFAVFQPFTFSRTKMLLDDFARVLSVPDVCVLTEIMGSREVNTFGISTDDLVGKMNNAVNCHTFEGVVNYLVENAGEGDLVITLGCGDIYKAAKMYIERLK